jgi:hypothetical protein
VTSSYGALVTAAEAVAAAGVVVAVVALAVLAGIAVATRPRTPKAAEPAVELGDEAPALVDLLTDDFEVTAEAVPATMVDLAARGWFHIERYGEANVVIRLRQSDPPGQAPPRPFEQQVLDHVQRLAIDGVVPARAMTTGPEAASRQWWKRFRAAVVADAQAADLCRARWRGVSVAFVTLGGLAALGCAWLGSNLAEESEELRLVDVLTMLAIAGGLGLLSLAAAIGASDRQRETPHGLDVAGRWLGVRRYVADHGNFDALEAAAVTIWDRYLAHAVALGLAPVVVAQLPLGAEDDRHAWSRATGQWRSVLVRYPRGVPGEGRHPVAVVLVGLVVAAGAIGVMRLLDEVPPFEEAAGRWAVGGVLAVAVAVGLFAAVTVLRAIADVFADSTHEGVLLRARMRETGDRLPGVLRVLRPEAGRRRRRYYLAVDEGTADELRAWRVRPAVYSSVVQGASVRAVVTPRLRYVRSIETVDTLRL